MERTRKRLGMQSYSASRAELISRILMLMVFFLSAINSVQRLDDTTAEH
jgi:hypothetical protein